MTDNGKSDPATDSYRKGWDRVFGPTSYPCGHIKIEGQDKCRYCTTENKNKPSQPNR